MSDEVLVQHEYGRSSAGTGLLRIMKCWYDLVLLSLLVMLVQSREMKWYCMNMGNKVLVQHKCGNFITAEVALCTRSSQDRRAVVKTDDTQFIMKPS